MKLHRVHCAVLLGLLTGAAQAGPVFVTGHDPDFHAQGSAGAKVLLNTALNYVTGGSYNGGIQKFLWVESSISPPPGHLVGENGLTAIGLIKGVNFDTANAAQFAGINLASYSAIAVASDFGGLLTSAEIGALDTRASDIATFVNAGGGLFASSECGASSANCQADLVSPTDHLFGFVPLSVSSVSTAAPYTVTAFGASFGLTNADINDPTHNSFAPVAGLNAVDTDANGVPTTLAGTVTIGSGGFTPVPEPSSAGLLGLSVIGLAALTRCRAV